MTNVGVIRDYARFALTKNLLLEYIRPLGKFGLTALAKASAGKIKQNECGVIEAFIGRSEVATRSAPTSEEEAGEAVS